MIWIYILIACLMVTVQFALNGSYIEAAVMIAVFLLFLIPTKRKLK